jgi:hypothetical protein
MNKSSDESGGTHQSDRPVSLAHEESLSPSSMHEPEDIYGSSDDELLAKCIEKQRSLPRSPLCGPPSVGGMRTGHRRETDNGLQRVVSPPRSRNHSGLLGNAKYQPDLLRGSVVEGDEDDEHEDEHIRKKLEEIVRSGSQHLQELRLSETAHIDTDVTALVSLISNC